MLTTEQIRAEMARVSYRPGWQMTVEEYGFEDPWVRIVCDVPDAYQPGAIITLGIESPLPPMVDATALHRWMVWRLARIEEHEAREFYRVDGSIVFDPHRRVMA